LLGFAKVGFLLDFAKLLMIYLRIVVGCFRHADMGKHVFFIHKFLFIKFWVIIINFKIIDGLGIDKFLGRLAGRVKRVCDKKQRLEGDEILDEDEEINEQFLGGFEQILDGKKDEHRRNVSFLIVFENNNRKFWLF
jgi:hypothetical protein